MGLVSFDISIHSSVLGFNTDINVLIPTEEEKTGEKKRYQVLYLFHGGHGGYTDFKRMTNIESWASARKLAVVMPSAANSFYQDMEKGEAYFTYLTEELPRICQRLFPISRKRENTFAGGVSMGGYGALRVALAKPEQYADAFSIAGAVDFSAGMYESINHLVWNPFKPYSLAKDPLHVTGTDSDLFALVHRLKQENKKIPGIYMRTGTRDIFCHHMNVTARQAFEKEGIPFDYQEADAEHEWGFWAKCLPEALDWLPLAREAVTD